MEHMDGRQWREQDRTDICGRLLLDANDQGGTTFRLNCGLTIDEEDSFGRDCPTRKLHKNVKA